MMGKEGGGEEEVGEDGGGDEVGEDGGGDEVKRVGERGFCLVQLNFNLKP